MKLRIATFQANVSAQVGHHLCGGMVPDAKRFSDPQCARGILLDDGRQRIVLCAVDYCELGGRFHDEWRRLLARAAGTTPDRVALHTVHQHDAPYLRGGMVRVGEQTGLKLLDRGWWAKTSRRLETAVCRATRRFRVVSQVGCGQARVRRAAGNRRILGKNGKVIDSRWSVCANRKIRNRPEGLIDPWMRSFTFWGPDDRLLATLSYYASHPQCASGRGIISADSPGEAHRLIRRKFPQTFHCYFTGCEGNVTFGKYSTLNRERNIRVLGQRLATGIIQAVRRSRQHRQPAAALQWKTVRFALPFRLRKPDPAWRRQAADATKPLHERSYAAHALGAWLDRRQLRRQVAHRLSLGGGHVVHLPGEVFVEYQLHGQRLGRGQSVAFAALGECSMGYIPTARAFREGGYESCAMASFTTPAAERKLKAVIAECLRG